MSGEDRARCVRSDPPLGAVSIIRCSMDGRERIGDAASGLLAITRSRLYPPSHDVYPRVTPLQPIVLLSGFQLRIGKVI